MSNTTTAAAAISGEMIDQMTEQQGGMATPSAVKGVLLSFLGGIANASGERVQATPTQAVQPVKARYVAVTTVDQGGKTVTKESYRLVFGATGERVYLSAASAMYHKLLIEVKTTGGEVIGYLFGPQRLGYDAVSQKFIIE